MAEENNKKPVSENDISSSIKELEYDGYKFKVDTDLLDDVEAFEYIDRIENKGQGGAIVPLITFMIGDQGLADMKAHFAKKDAEAHADIPNYKGRFRVSQLIKVYETIVAEFDPKG
jgi:hypothetical protein